MRNNERVALGWPLDTANMNSQEVPFITISEHSNGYDSAVSLLGIVLLCVGLIVLWKATTRRVLCVYLISALLPITVGLFGTWHDYQFIHRIRTEGLYHQEESDHLYKHAWSHTYRGMGASVPILLIGTIAAACKRKRVRLHLQPPIPLTSVRGNGR